MSSLAARLDSVALPPAARSVACVHCGSVITSAVEDRFCCLGCASAHRLINELGFQKFYDRRVLDPEAQPLRPVEGPATDYAKFVVVDASGQATLSLLVDGLTCAACVWLIESVLAREPALVDGRVNFSTRRLTLRWIGPVSDAARYAGLVTALGFRVVPFDARQAVDVNAAAERELLRALAVAGFAAGNIMLLSVSVWTGHAEGMGPATRDLMHWVSALIALPAVAYAGRPFFRSAIAALRAGRTNMDVPISIGVVLAATVSLFETASSGSHAYFDSAVTLLFFLLIGRYLDVRARGQARAAVSHLLMLGATPVTVVNADGTTALKVPGDVQPGEVVLIATGERIAVDGRVIQGSSDLDTSLVTGESVPMAAGSGTDVFAGMINLTAPLRIGVTASGERTLLAEIVRLMEAAERGRTRFVALADRVAQRYAPVVHVLAAATFLGWFGFGGIGWQPALLNAVAVLIITCPCALALAVPVVQVVASGRLSRAGILLKNATALERLATIDTVIFDKTGTLTLGELELEKVAAGIDDDLRLAAAIAGSSRHPLARALVRACPGVAPLQNVVEHPGSGLSVTRDGETIRLGSRSFCGVGEQDAATGHGPELWLARPGQAPVRFAFSDRLRPDAALVVARLKRDGLRVELLSGDRAPVVAAVAGATGIETWHSDYDPARKCAYLEELARSGRRVLMVGDGLNDAPALAAASVSLSPATGADVSQTVADAVFQGERLAAVAEILDVARRSGRLVVQNLVLAILYNIGAVPLAVAGLVTPLIAAVAMSSSSVLVIMNALRLQRRGGRQ
jgi:Cu2+-exporting ATPase